jgi:hypothetical protein
VKKLVDVVLLFLAANLASAADQTTGAFSKIPAADSPAAEPCPGAASWNREHPSPMESSQTRAAIANADLLKDLQVRFEKDQLARRQWLADPKNESLARAVDAIDTANLAWLRNLVAEMGFPTARQVGNEGVHLAWVLLQHADQDPELQSRLLPVLEKRYQAGELPPNDLARMTDRILVASGKPQKYGTQFDWFAKDFELPGPIRLAEIDTEREHLKLMPLGDYVCTIRKERDNVTRRAAPPDNPSQGSGSR